ncbi:hypothetical protein EHI8A_057430 [Entamoeba histolytica HM-1:IMSS-B]|uniref:Uncharacterized protein n=6 Tax=Entamoeba histolytica TaxID=5759 RepID=C4LZT3_ENTH1|nr:hypothetical protein EHI_194180 [Entamoeba histolytica HM-1:IMSS]EMD48202.1 Hypothetical protein EHI5A_089300 [Entamoeba histolytica KU27]EMH72485.1 hypothetical protein EHI8A_057430 [Entamoeba histolytica HM-1:IMSS-B]EMS13672.1 hypothetical protein KM1_110740 [Entamoeba histolytica HM-3:IMSS]ENY65472.1 hypothetical protein EHI7A_055560 [Entamoeba histolytica HM-1:IMSS-A]GAT94391.1 hypothetical protein CL6EHI_194180 [Entamoeba histolytica]|eukprot:XP_654719.1 hypothetical protein EHI_194180 [Entamoeba histolytica HM-1:IMSS]
MEVKGKETKPIQNTGNETKELPKITNSLENVQKGIKQTQEKNVSFEDETKEEEISKEYTFENEEYNEETEKKEGDDLLFTENSIINAASIQDKINTKEEKAEKKKNPNNKLKNEWKKLKKSLDSHQKKIIDAYIDYKVEKKVNKIIQQLQKDETFNQFEMSKKNFKVNEEKIKYYIKQQQKDMKHFIQKQILYQRMMYQYPYYYYPYCYYPQPYNINGDSPYFFNQFNSIEQPLSYNHQYCYGKTCSCLTQKNQQHTPTHQVSSAPIQNEVEQTLHQSSHHASSQSINLDRKLESQTKQEIENLFPHSPTPPFQVPQFQQPNLVCPCYPQADNQRLCSNFGQPQYSQPFQ